MAIHFNLNHDYNLTYDIDFNFQRFIVMRDWMRVYKWSVGVKVGVKERDGHDRLHALLDEKL